MAICCPRNPTCQSHRQSYTPVLRCTGCSGLDAVKQTSHCSNTGKVQVHSRHTHTHTHTHTHIHTHTHTHTHTHARTQHKREQRESRGESPVGRTLLPVGRPSGGGCGVGRPGDQCRHTSTPSAHTTLPLARALTFNTFSEQTARRVSEDPKSINTETAQSSVLSAWLAALSMPAYAHAMNQVQPGCCVR